MRGKVGPAHQNAKVPLLSAVIPYWSNWPDHGTVESLT